MFKNLQEVKDFINWAKENKVKSFKINDIAFELSELSFLPDSNQANIDLKEAIGDTLTDTEKVDNVEEDELLFWSVQK